jgi:NADH:ubiquinone oxidoreductase subunit 2 (subunit N)
MNAAGLWILVPLVAAGILFMLRRFYRVSVALGGALAMILALLALVLPVGQEIHLGSHVLVVNSALYIFGRSFLFANGERPLLAMVYGLSAFWFLAAYAARAGRMFVPLSLAIVALLTAALAVEPFLYAGLLIGLAILLSIPILAPPGAPILQGVLRYLTFSSLGLPLILFTGWMLAGVEAKPGDAVLITRASALLGLGFMLLMGVFPFHTWVLMLSERAHPYVVAFILFMVPWMLSLFGLSFLERYAWMNNAEFFRFLRLVGVLMVAVAGSWCAFERHLGRQMGYSILVQTGYSIVTASLSGGLSLFFIMIVPRVISLAVWGLSLSVLKSRSPGLLFRDVAGQGRNFPFASAALVTAQFSIAGLPTLASFPVYLAVWTGLAQVNILAVLGILVGSVGLSVAAIRTLTVLVTGPNETPWTIQENSFMGGILGLGILALLAVGIFPQFFLPPLLGGLSSFPQLIP